MKYRDNHFTSYDVALHCHIIKFGDVDNKITVNKRLNLYLC